MKQRSKSSYINFTFNKSIPLEVKQMNSLILKNASIYLDQANEIKGIYNKLCYSKQKKKVSSSVNNGISLQDSSQNEIKYLFNQNDISLPKNQHNKKYYSTSIDFFKKQKTSQHQLSSENFLKELSLQKPIENYTMNELKFNAKSSETVNSPNKDLNFYKNYFSKTDKLIKSTSLIDTLSINKLNISELGETKKVGMRKANPRNDKRQFFSRHLFFQKSINHNNPEAFKDNSFINNFPKSKSINDIQANQKGIMIINNPFTNETIIHNNNNRSQIDKKNITIDSKTILFKEKGINNPIVQEKHFNKSYRKIKSIDSGKTKQEPSIMYKIRKKKLLSFNLSFIPKEIKDKKSDNINLPHLIKICSSNQSKNILNH